MQGEVLVGATGVYVGAGHDGEERIDCGDLAYLLAACQWIVKVILFSCREVSCSARSDVKRI